jgi:hypothetical protein
LSETEPIEFHRRAAALRPAGGHSNTQAADQPPVTAFNRQELNAIMALYGRKVAAGEWRDYALDLNRDKAIFSVFRRTCEYPLYRIEKCPKLARKQGSYSVVTTTGLILKRGHDLARVLAVLESKMQLVD